MEKGLKAFFYEYKYYLFPEDCLTLSELKKRDCVTVKRLKEERCMAPDFIYESIAEEELKIENPDRLFEVEVNLYSGQEYDEILRKHVERVCPGCERYIPDGDPRDTGNLDGHHREISLDGTCYERESANETWSFAFCAQVFWYRISSHLNELAVCIDRGNQKKLNKIINSELKKFFPETEFYGTVYEGKYCLCFRVYTGMPTTLIMLYTYLAEVASREKGEFLEAGWKVLPYCPEKVLKYKGKTKIEKLSARLTENSGFRNIVVRAPKAISRRRQKKIAHNICDWLAQELGDGKTNFVVASVMFSEEAGEYVPFQKIAEQLNELYSERYPEPAEMFPPAMGYSVDAEAAKTALPFREHVEEGATGCGAMSFLDREELQKEKPWWLSITSYGYLYIPRAVDMPDNPMEVIGWYMSNGNLVPEPLRDPSDTTPAGRGIGFAFCGENGFIVEFMVADEKKFFRKLRILAPVLKAYRAKAVLVNEEGVMAYDCGYEFNPVENGEVIK